MAPGTASRRDVPDDVLVDQARQGDRRALEELLRRHQPRIHAVCRRVVGEHADAADATQEALIAVVRGLDRFDGRASFGTWVYRIATNAALDELRRKRRRSLLGRDQDVSDAPTPHEPAAPAPTESFGDRLLLDAALARLPEEFRVAVVLRDVADLDYAEIASVLDIPPGTVRSRIARGRAALAAQLGNPGDLDGRPTPERTQRPT